MDLIFQKNTYRYGSSSRSQKIITKGCNWYLAPITHIKKQPEIPE